MILYSQKKSQIQFPVFETKYHPRYHSNWHKAPLLRIQSYTPQGNGCGLRQFLLSLNRISKLPSKVHSANSSLPQSHRLRLSVMFCCCLLLFLIGFAYVAIYHTIGFCCCQVIIFGNFPSLSQCHRNPMLYRPGQFLNHSPWQQGSVAAFFREQEAFACHWIKATVYL